MTESEYLEADRIMKEIRRIETYVEMLDHTESEILIRKGAGGTEELASGTRTDIKRYFKKALMELRVDLKEQFSKIGCNTDTKTETSFMSDF